MQQSDNANVLRKNLTESEKKLWQHLRSRNFFNLKFRRQVPIGKYIVDFACMEMKLVIELDGGQHNFESNLEKDVIRDKYLFDNGFKALRFWNIDIFKNFDSVLETIARELNLL